MCAYIHTYTHTYIYRGEVFLKMGSYHAPLMAIFDKDNVDKSVDSYRVDS